MIMMMMVKMKKNTRFDCKAPINTNNNTISSSSSSSNHRERERVRERVIQSVVVYLCVRIDVTNELSVIFDGIVCMIYESME